MRRLVVSCLVVAALLVSGLSSAASAPPPGQGQPAPPAAAPAFKVGAASRSVLPLVDGARDYLSSPDIPGPEDATSPGVFVEAFDAGRVAVGNGHPDAHWVRDDLRVRSVAVEQLRGGGDIVVMASADLYMIFRPEADEIRARARALLPSSLRDRVDIAIATTHNHHGPDTAFDVNHVWYDQMMDEAAAAIAESVLDLRPARLTVADGNLWFGMRDSRDPVVIDPTMNALQATATNGDVIATLVQWNNHPEVTLGWTPTEDRSADCAVLGEASPCTRNRYFTSDFTGRMATTIEDRVGGVAPIFVGALGGLITPLRAAIWEVTDEIGLGDQFNPPVGAQPAGHDTSFTDANFRRAVVLGEQGAAHALRLLDQGEVITDASLSYETRDVYTRMSNIGFRLLAVVDPGTGRPAIGHLPGMLYRCPTAGPKDASTCEADDFGTEADPLVGTIRAGDHIRTEVAYLRLGPIGMVWMPGEVVGELVIGLPAGFDDDPAAWFSGPLELHAAGPALETGGYVHSLMTDRYRWTIGLGNDELGYVVPISDWRVLCVAGAAACAGLHAAGLIAHPDSLSGEQCKEITENPAVLLPYPPDIQQALGASCRYGQALGQAESHYEETNSVGWDLAADILDAVSALTGIGPSARINPDFPGYWSQLPPPT
jgi:hypothetical protein